MIRDIKCNNCRAREINCFFNLPDDDLCELSRAKVTTIYKKGQTIFYEGMEPTGIYCLNKGRIKISKNGLDGREQIVRLVVEGDLLGIRALLGGRVYFASATTLDDCIVCYISKMTFFRLKLKYPEISSYLMTLLSKLLEEAEIKIASLAQKPVRERVAESLLLLHNVFKNNDSENAGDGVERMISLSREDLANVVGTATETLIRTLSEFKEEKLVDIKGRKIQLLDIERLKKAGKIYQ